MGNGNTQQSNSTWPVSNFKFAVKIGVKESFFQEVSGLSTETDIIEYRHGDSKQFSAIKMPGIKKTSDVTLKKGIFVNDKDFLDFYNQLKMNAVKRENATISLLDENNNVAMSWKLINAFPIKITALDFKEGANEIVIETIVLAHEGFEVM